MEATLRKVPDCVNVAPRTVVAIAPSDIDPIWDEMRVEAGGRLVLRAFDPGQPIVTGAPIEYVTMGGEPYVTVGGEPIVTVVE